MEREGWVGYCSVYEVLIRLVYWNDDVTITIIMRGEVGRKRDLQTLKRHLF